MTRHQCLIKGLSKRLERIIQEAQNLEKYPDSERDYSRFYQEIAYYVHYIVKNEEFKKIILDLIAYIPKLKDNPNYDNTKHNIESCIRELSKEILKHENYESFKKTSITEYLNPYQIHQQLRIDPLLKLLSEFRFNKDYDLKESVGNISGIIDSVINDWAFQSQEHVFQLTDKLGLISKEVANIQFCEVFEHDYYGVKSALNISKIYSSLNPRTQFGKEYSTYETIISELIVKGESVREKFNLEELKSDCLKVYDILQDKINSRLSIEYVIDRFSTYISLYQRDNIDFANPERIFQKKFEEFIFHEGYYPISEAQLNDGRIDSLVFNNENSFLFEFKQVDLGSKEEGELQISNKLKSAQIQSSIYSERLRNLPDISDSVFIILFTNRKVSFKGNIDRVDINGINFIFKSIAVYEDVPSKVHNDCEIDINELIK